MNITIKEYDKERFLKKVNKIIDAFEAKGKEIKLKEIDHGTTTINKGSDWTSSKGYKWSEIIVPTITYEITGDLESKGYYIVGLVEQQSDSVVIDTIINNVEGHDIKIPQRFYDMTKIECDECHQNRRRNTGEIVYNPVEDNYLCIGTGCINDFMGFPVGLINDLFSIKKEETDNSKPKTTRGSLMDNWFYKPEEIYAITNALFKNGIRYLGDDVVAKTLVDINYFMINDIPLTPENIKKTYLKDKFTKVLDYICSHDTDEDFEKFCVWLNNEKDQPWTSMYSYKDVIQNAENCLLSDKLTAHGAKALATAVSVYSKFDSILADYDRQVKEKEKLNAYWDEFNSLKEGEVTSLVIPKKTLMLSNSNRPSTCESKKGVIYKWWPNQNEKVMGALKDNGFDEFEINAKIVKIQNDSWGRSAFILPVEQKSEISKDEKSNKEFIKLEHGEEIAIDISSTKLTNTHGRSYTAEFTDPSGRKYTYNFNTTYTPKGFKDDIQKASKVIAKVASDRGAYVQLNGFEPLKIVSKLNESTENNRSILNIDLIYEPNEGQLFDIDGFMNGLRYSVEYDKNKNWDKIYEIYKDCSTVDALFERNEENKNLLIIEKFSFETDANKIINIKDADLEIEDIEESDEVVRIIFKDNRKSNDDSQICKKIKETSIIGKSKYFTIDFVGNNTFVYIFNKLEGYNF